MDKKGDIWFRSIIGIVISVSLLLSTTSSAYTEQNIFGGARGNVAGVTSAMQTYVSNNGLLSNDINSLSQIRMDSNAVMSEKGGNAITVQQYLRQGDDSGLLTNMVTKFHGTNIKDIQFASIDGRIDLNERLVTPSDTVALAFAANNMANINLVPGELQAARGSVENAGAFLCVNQVSSENIPEQDTTTTSSTSEQTSTEDTSNQGKLPDVSFDNLYQVYQAPTADSIEERRDQIPSSYEISFVADDFLINSGDTSIGSNEVNAFLDCYYLINGDKEIALAGYDFKGYAEYDDIEFSSGMSLFLADPMSK
jgi:hypothetical protein